MNRIMICLVIVFAIIFTSCVTTNSESTKPLLFDSKQNIFTHGQSGFSFPSRIGRFQRDDENINFYDESGDNFSVPYNLVTADEQVIATIYVYQPVRDYSGTHKIAQTPDWLLDEQYDDAKNAIIDYYKARVKSEDDITLGRSALNPGGKKGIFEWDTVSGETVLSHLYLFAHHGWLVKYRFSFPSKQNGVAESDIKTFISLWQWP